MDKIINLNIACYNAGYKGGKKINGKGFDKLVDQANLKNNDIVVFQEAVGVKIDGLDGYISNIMVNANCKIYTKAKELMILYNKLIFKVEIVFYTSLRLQVVIFMHIESKSKFAIFNTHLHQKGKNEYHQYENTLEMVGKLIKLLKGIPIIMCGDFNRNQCDLKGYTEYFNFANSSNLETTVCKRRVGNKYDHFLISEGIKVIGEIKTNDCLKNKVRDFSPKGKRSMINHVSIFGEFAIECNQINTYKLIEEIKNSENSIFLEKPKSAPPTTKKIKESTHNHYKNNPPPIKKETIVHASPLQSLPLENESKQSKIIELYNLNWKFSIAKFFRDHVKVRSKSTLSRYLKGTSSNTDIENRIISYLKGINILN